MKLRGDHNQCPTCGEYFNSTSAFDKHRTGKFGVDRRCRTVEEMKARGMVKNAGGWWVSEMLPEGERIVLESIRGGGVATTLPTLRPDRS